MCDEIKYLGHHIVKDLSEDNEISRLCWKMDAQAHTLAGKFSMYSVKVMVALCSALYCPLVVVFYIKSNIQRLSVALYDGMRLLLKLSAR